MRFKMKRTAILMDSFDARRRAFLRALTGAMSVFAVAGCGGGGSSGGAPVAAAPAPGPGPAPAPGANVAPVWAAVPTVTFTQGVASSFPLASFVSDPNGDALTLSMNAIGLPAGVTFDAANKRLVYNGIGGAATVGGVQMTADDGRP